MNVGAGFLGLAVAIALPFAALAQSDWVYVSNEGHQYILTMNQNGAVLESLYPVARFSGMGAMTQIITGTETLYLGRDCDAFSKVLGPGSWAWANGGFVVEFDAQPIWFPRQEIDMSNGYKCEQN